MVKQVLLVLQDNQERLDQLVLPEIKETRSVSYMYMYILLSLNADTTSANMLMCIHAESEFCAEFAH